MHSKQQQLSLLHTELGTESQFYKNHTQLFILYVPETRCSVDDPTDTPPACLVWGDTVAIWQQKLSSLGGDDAVPKWGRKREATRHQLFSFPVRDSIPEEMGLENRTKECYKPPPSEVARIKGDDVRCEIRQRYKIKRWISQESILICCCCVQGPVQWVIFKQRYHRVATD